MATAKATDFATQKKFFLGMLLLTLVGIGLDIELTRLHYQVHTDPKASSWCSMNKKVDCTAVELSDYAMMLDVPVSVWSLLAHLLVLGLLFWGWRRRGEGLFPYGLTAVFGLFAFGFSGYMGYISLAVLKVICLMCAGLYAVAVLFLFFSLWALKANGLNLVQAFKDDLKLLFGTPTVLVPATVAVLAICAGLVVGYPKWYVPIGKIKIKPGKNLVGKMNHGVEESHPWIGPWDKTMGKKPIDIYEISDYECPYCRHYHLSLRSFLLKSKLPLRLFHLNYPLGMACNENLKKAGREMHANACEAAYAGLCAIKQGKFWQLNDLMFINQDVVKRGSLDLLLQRSGVDVGKLRACMKGDEVKEQLKKEMEFGRKVKLLGTPTYVIKGLTAEQCKKARGIKTDVYCRLAQPLDEDSAKAIVEMVYPPK